MKEIWKPIKNFEDLYEISNLGRIRREWHGKYKYLKTKQNSGYHKANLSKNGTSKSRAVHQLVMETFKDIDFKTLPKNLESHHIDGNPSNNQIDNLIIITKIDHQRISAKQRFENWRKRTAQRIRYENLINNIIDRQQIDETGGDDKCRNTV